MRLALTADEKYEGCEHDQQRHSRQPENNGVHLDDNSGWCAFAKIHYTLLQGLEGRPQCTDCGQCLLSVRRLDRVKKRRPRTQLICVHFIAATMKAITAT
ncbi:MAG TPA: hypothetical protein VGN93_29345 [Shinella sp.]|jgi:hypothetical protein|nr:hypothetical protein [Shinella sp.]